MKLSWLKFAFYNTLRNRRRSAITVVIAALGTAAILLAGGFAYSTYEGLAQISARSTGHLTIGKPQHFTSDQDVPLQYGLENAAALQSKLLADPAVRYVLPRIEYSGLISNGDKSTIMMAVGIDPDAEFSVKGPTLTLKEGELLQTESAEAEIVLGDALARSLKAKPGSSLTLMASTTDGALNAVDVTVKGLVSTGVPELDKRLVYSNIKTAQKLLNTQRISSLGVFLNSMDATLPAQARLAKVFPELTVQNWLEQAFFYKSVRDLYNRIFGALGAIISVIVVFVVANAMAMAIIERTREVGTLRAMGTLPGQLIRSFSFEGMILGGTGAIAGALLAITVALLLMVFPVEMPPPPGRSSGYPLLITIDAAMYAITVFMMIALSMLSSAFIARKTLRQPIVDALAHN
ncbi:ABC transporter permease [Undibacterium pigrum]|uniref:Putative ABC transport system permease protein n=1 Tax=Undibacterium pigrum TaxID=401470 RepID=A0A318J807_9BURK|nr:FtsX-like permease family protein [Undibacterium pigrum]PXX43283.1 putative ABC transport system permease protein [Undibacterium pigrum]